MGFTLPRGRQYYLKMIQILPGLEFDNIVLPFLILEIQVFVNKTNK